ncbi:hypothetical protein BJV74DRAFT_881694 [Russula compacta]|nr:hypothetical protein BJV74DRAFT_881694 [Russula compacta]
MSIVPVTGLADVSGSGLLIASSLIRTAKNVKIYRSQCEHLSKQCLDLASALRDHSPGLEGTPAQQAVDEVERVLTRILNRVRRWGDMGKMRSFVKQTEIRVGIDESYQELRTCSMQFNIALHLNANTRGRELEDIRKRDHDELIEMMTRMLQDKSLLRIELATGTPEDAHKVVQAIEQARELKGADVGETQERQLQEDFGELRKWVERLPPMDDLSGNVSRTSDHAIATGGSQDIYTGEWTGREVALAYPRNQSRAAQERFKRQVEIWRTIRHPNILQLLGIAYIGDFVYSVSPYMEFGNVKQYLKDYPEANRVLLLSEIASGTSLAAYRISAYEPDHPRRFTGGESPFSNVLVSGDGHACLGDFGSARIEEVPVTEAITYGSLRWLAPELVADSRYVPTTRATDVWSFGMLSMEIFTDDVPFNHISNDAFVPIVIHDGPLPIRPEHNITMRGLGDAMWKLMNQCWQRDPSSRPSMSEIRETTQNMNPLRSYSRSTRSPSSIHIAGNQHGASFSDTVRAPGGAHPSSLTLSRPPRITDSTPPTAPLPIPKPLAHNEPELELPQRGTPATFPMRKSPILNIPLSSSPPSQLGLASESRSATGKPIPMPKNPSPLSSSFQIPLPSTTPESCSSVSPPNDHLDWSLHPPMLIQEASTSSRHESSLLLQPVHATSSPKPGSAEEHRRFGSTSTGSVHSANRSMSSSSSGGLLDAAVRDTQPLVRRTADGTVEAGTLEGLVDRLIKDTHDHAKDNEVKRVFLGTYRLFTTGEDLFRCLKRRLGDIGTSISSGSIRYSTLLLLRTWLRAEGEHLGRELLSSIREFSRSVGGSDTMREVAQEIVDLASEKMNAVIIPTSPSQSLDGIMPPPSPQQFKPTDIAISLTVIEGDYYSKITQIDYITHLRGTPITKHIESATKINNCLVNWVKRKILSSEDVNKRASNFKLFVLVAEECKKLQNFSSASAIIAALQSAQQLILTRESKLTKSEKQLLCQLDEMIAVQGDYRGYREVLQNTKSPFVIPWLAFHLRRLQTFYDRSSAAVVVDQRPLINFSRCARLLERIDDVRRYRAPPPEHLLDKHRRRRGASPASMPAHAWVKKELDDAPSAIEQFEELVSALAELEHQMRESRELELRSVGFKVPPRQRRSSGSSSLALSPGGRMASLDSRLGKI